MDASGGKSRPRVPASQAKTPAEEDYVPFKSVPDSVSGDRGVLGTRKR
jgi:hypothetical protein